MAAQRALTVLPLNPEQVAQMPLVRPRYADESRLRTRTADQLRHHARRTLARKNSHRTRHWTRRTPGEPTSVESHSDGLTAPSSAASGNRGIP